jgi:hypothetical protein
MFMADAEADGPIGIRLNLLAAYGNKYALSDGTAMFVERDVAVRNEITTKLSGGAWDEFTYMRCHDQTTEGVINLDNRTDRLETSNSTQDLNIRTNLSGVASNSTSIDNLNDLTNGLSADGIKASDGKNLIKKVGSAIHIGENSLVTVESDGVQKLYATDAKGDAIPINITRGSDLQINGVSVQGQLDTNVANIRNNTNAINNNRKKIDDLKINVNNLGFGMAGATALSTAMSALPTVAQDSPLSCGVGTGGYSNRFAMSVGCAVKANDRLSINAGGSYVLGGAADYGNGSLSTAAARAGFVFKFGKLETPAASNEQLQSQLNEVKDENEELRARLDRLEAIALGNQPASKTVSLK